MATITITEILGSDNLAGSRITLNNNFKTLQNAVNTLEQRLDTSFSPGGSLNVGDALIKKYTRPTSQIIWVVEASGQVQGDFYVVGATNTTGSVAIGTDLTVAKNVTFSNVAPGTFTLQNALRTYATNGYAHEQFYAANTNSGVVVPNTLLPLASPIRNLDPTLFWNRRVIHIDLTLNTGAITDCNVLTLPTVSSAAVANGQIVTFVFDLPATGVSAPLTDLFSIDNTNMDPIYTTPIILNSNSVTGEFIELNSVDSQKIEITLYAASTGWKVISAYHSVNPTTY